MLQTRFRPSWAALFVASTFFASATLATAAGVQFTRDQSETLVNKDVGNERWAITYRISDGRVTGNVTIAGQAAPVFLECSQEAVSADGIGTFRCDTADACSQDPCSPSEWSYLATSDLPIAFFFPPAAPSPPDVGCNNSLTINDCSGISTDNCSEWLERSPAGDFWCKNSDDGSNRCVRGELCVGE